MKNKLKSNTYFVVDPALLPEESAPLINRVLEEDKLKVIKDYSSVSESDELYVFFLKKSNARKISKFKNKIMVVPDDNEEDSINFVKLNFTSFEEIGQFVSNYIYAERRTLIQDKLKEGDSFFEEIKRKIENHEVSYDENFAKSYEQLIDLEIDFLKTDNLENWNKYLSVLLKKIGHITELKIIESQELYHDDISLDGQTYILKLPCDNLYLYARLKKNPSDSELSVLYFLAISAARSIQATDHKLVRENGEVDFWKMIFSKIPYPMAIISDLGDLLTYNESFAKTGILPKECLNYHDFQNVEIYKNFYKIRRIDFENNLSKISYFIFYTVEKNQYEDVRDGNNKKRKGMDELGIISSSIAHELNNPLAGILAAISLLELEDDWTKEAFGDLQDMKSGAKRCKELVEIFLGFSKFSPSAHLKISIKESLDQAINLLRFRMIESNLRVEMNYLPTLEKFSHQVNSSIMSMIFYLICSELMTAYAHHRLVTMDSHGSLNGEVLEFSNQIVIKLEEDFEYETNLAQSKLIQHLLVFEKIEISFLQQEIRLVHREV